MNFKEHLLIKASEECGEIIQALSKIARFGPESCHPDSTVTNAAELSSEIEDLLAVVELMAGESLVRNNATPLRSRITEKKIKLLQFAELSVALGTLDEVPSNYHIPKKEQT